MRQRIILAACLLLFGSSVVHGQEHADSVMLSGLRVLDGYTEEKITDACITIIDKETGAVLCDSLPPLIGHGSGGGKTWTVFLWYQGKVPRRQRYVVKMTVQEYENVETEVDLGKKWRTMERYNFDKPSYLWYQATDLKEVGVEASKIMMVHKGDTLVFNAGNFRLAEGSMLDDLVRALPGVEIDENGRITVDGQYVSNLLVQGRDFFKGDPRVALRNLPAYTVDKVKVYRKTDRWGVKRELTEEERKESPLVMDVGLKRQYQQGWISNYEAGGGTTIGDKSGGRWMGRAFALRYTNHSSLAIYGSANNISDDASPSSKGEWQRRDDGTGDTHLYSGGIQFTLDPKDSRMHYATSLQAKRLENRELSCMMAETYYDAGNTLMHESGDSQRTTAEIDWDGMVSRDIPMGNVSLKPALHYSRGKHIRLNSSDETSDSDTLYSRTLSSTQRATRYGAKMSLEGGKFFNGIHRLVFSADFSYNKATEREHVGDFISRAQTGAGNLDELRRSDCPAHDHLFSFSLVSPQWRTRTAKHRPSLGVSADYRYTQRFNSGGQQLEYSRADSVTPSAASEASYLLDLANSYHTTRMEHVHNLKPALRLEWGQLPSLTVSVDMWATDRRITDFRNEEHQRMERFNFMADPKVGLMKRFACEDGFQHALSVDMGCESSLPNLMYLLDVRDSSDPLRIVRGNAGLKPTRNWYVGGQYDRTLKWHNFRCQLNAMCQTWNGSVGMARLLDRSTGATTTLPMNVEGNSSAEATAYVALYLDKKSHWHLSNVLTYRRQRSVDFTGEGTVDADGTASLDTRRVTTDYVGGTLKLDYRHDKWSAGATVRHRYHHLYSGDPGFSPFSYTNLNCGLTVTASLPWEIDLSTDFMAYTRCGYADPTMNATDWVWNAQLTRALGKRKQWVVKITSFDLLQQLSSVKQEVNAQGRIETWHNTTPSYAIATLTYRLDVKPKKLK